MKIRLTNPITHRSRTYRARLTTGHPESHYGIPVMLLDDGEILDAQNVVLQRAIMIEEPKGKDQTRMFCAWIQNIQMIE